MKPFDDTSEKRNKIMRMVSERISKSPSPTPRMKNNNQNNSVTPRKNIQSQEELITIVETMQKQINQLNKTINNIQQNSSQSYSEVLMEQKQRELDLQKEQLARNDKQIKELIEQNHKRTREIQYLRLQMSRSLSISDVSVSKIEQNNYLGISQFNDFMKKQQQQPFRISNVSRIPKRTEDCIVSPLSMSLAKQNFRIEDSNAFCFQNTE